MSKENILLKLAFFLTTDEEEITLTKKEVKNINNEFLRLYKIIKKESKNE